jgi:hypothetical protein
MEVSVMANTLRGLLLGAVMLAVAFFLVNVLADRLESHAKTSTEAAAVP